MFPFLRGAGGKLRETIQNLFQTPFRGNPDGVFIARQESSTIAWNTSAFCTRRRWHPSRRTSRSTLIVATVTTRTKKKKNQPTHVLVDSNPAFEEPSMILLEQIFTIDKSRMQVMRSCGPHPSFSHSAFNAAAVSASMPSFRRRAGCQRVELSLCALARGVGACRLHSDGRSCRCSRNCLRRLLYGARLWPRCRNVITRYNTFASVICKVQWTLRSLSEGTSPAGKLRLKNWINCK